MIGFYIFTYISSDPYHTELEDPDSQNPKLEDPNSNLHHAELEYPDSLKITKFRKTVFICFVFISPPPPPLGTRHIGTFYSQFPLARQAINFANTIPLLCENGIIFSPLLRFSLVYTLLYLHRYKELFYATVWKQIY